MQGNCLAFEECSEITRFFWVISRYRYYGVYFTNEDSSADAYSTGHCDIEDSLDILRNPMVVLEKNSESYVNLRYPLEPTTTHPHQRI